MTRTERVTNLLIWGLLIFAVVYFGGHVLLSGTRESRRPVAVQEDEPGWDCQTMGNKVCGR